MGDSGGLRATGIISPAAQSEIYSPEREDKNHMPTDRVLMSEAEAIILPKAMFS